jgi:hypothetical protein
LPEVESDAIAKGTDAEEQEAALAAEDSHGENGPGEDWIPGRRTRRQRRGLRPDAGPRAPAPSGFPPRMHG